MGCTIHRERPPGGRPTRRPFMPVAPVSRRRFLALSGAAAAHAALGCAAADSSATPTTGSAAGSTVGPKYDTGPLTAGNTDFAANLYGRLRTEPGNLFLSPFSISVALAMTSA